MQAVHNNIHFVAQSNVRYPRWHLTASIQHRATVMATWWVLLADYTGALWYLLRYAAEGLQAHFFELDNNTNYRPNSTDNYYKFPTSTCTPSNKKLSRFEDERFNIVYKMEFKNFNNSFQSKLRTNIKTIQKYKYIYIYLLTILVMFINIDPSNIRNYYMTT